MPHLTGKPSDLELAQVRACERIEAAAWSDLAAAAPMELREDLGLSIEPFADGIAIITSKVKTVLYNRVFAFGLDRPIEETELRRVIKRFRADRPFAIQPTPIARPANLSDWLEQHGLPVHFNWVRWVRSTGRIEAATELSIEIVKAEQAHVFADLAFEIFDEPVALRPWLRLAVGRAGWTCYVGREGDRPVSVAAMFIKDGIAWLGWGGTLPSHRGQGAQSAMIARRMADAHAAGCRFATTETADDLPERPSPSFRNMRRAGFTLLYRRPSHAYTPPVRPQE